VACKGTHVIVGGTGGLVAYGLIKWFRNEEWTWDGALAAIGCGAVIGICPDLLEPALHPNHRAAFHSLTLLAGIAYANKKVLESPSASKEAKISTAVASLAYASHLLLDAGTTKGLPLLGLKG